ncbi:putative zinc-binding metallopeptidase [Thiomicrorhabdus sp. 6S3-12]|uniref:zinc-binding metallopeptidase family protein n=1 Tax=Thiomicrorhabdus sp. 6S3-12 TaxID=2819681 RepID=UPI001AAD0C09|nr:putative zinc-binding metallopeptidase [Thiomicrorhabdus sp. 6S3-12]MBO1924665.1 putative zinc-binding metallopeptidase [Thiomicrorhabdus sp. 6S3-12]
MKRFYCICGEEVFFYDHVCKNCGRDLAYDPQIGTMWSGELVQNRFIAHSGNKKQSLDFTVCEHRSADVGCNWLLSNTDSNCQCIACRTTRTIPDQSYEKNLNRWFHLERCKRQLFQTLIALRLIDARRPEQIANLQFDFLEDKRSNPNIDIEHVLTGHSDGLITLNAAEADEGFLHTMKEQMQERYRTLLGHFRHEIGHYFWGTLFATDDQKMKFREVFGDEREDYNEALERYYQQGKQNHWRGRYITPYASSHPHEDWAETWSHYLHIVDTLQTAQSYGLSAYDPQEHNFDHWFSEWHRVTQVMNALNRSMGVSDPYPFKVSDIVQGKLRFIDETIAAYVASIKTSPE